MTTYEPADWRPEPGDVVEATNRHGTFRCRVSSACLTLKLSNNGYVTNPSHVRRLQVVDPASTVVLDPDNPDDVQRLSVALAKYDDDESAYSVTADNVLRSLLPVVTPPEPNGLGAVVEASHSEIAGYGVFDGESWCFRYGAGADHSLPPGSLDIVTVVQHGVGCSCGAPDCNGGDQ